MRISNTGPNPRRTSLSMREYYSSCYDRIMNTEDTLSADGVALNGVSANVRTSRAGAFIIIIIIIIIIFFFYQGYL